MTPSSTHPSLSQSLAASPHVKEVLSFAFYLTPAKKPGSLFLADFALLSKTERKRNSATLKPGTTFLFNLPYIFQKFYNSIVYHSSFQEKKKRFIFFSLAVQKALHFLGHIIIIVAFLWPFSSSILLSQQRRVFKRSYFGE